MKKRSDCDFSKHVLITEINPRFRIHWLKLPDTTNFNVKFTNIDEVLLVTGDFGRWTFCREFWPSASSEGISDGYWCDKLQTWSTQNAMVWDYDTAIEELEELKKEYTIADGYDDRIHEWIDNCIIAIGDKYDFVPAIRNLHYASDIEYEDLPNGEIIEPTLAIIFDAFEEICERIKKSENEGRGNRENDKRK
ncbi:MAG: hypothetical protein GY797_33545 [Deltaproteobacteria bacterium]|nr:hypothetical protein [Deltaproteobacteria bacterium]